MLEKMNKHIQQGLGSLVRTDKTADELENVEPATVWQQYLQYLRDWVDSHSEVTFYGMTPACFEEWLGCDYQEEVASDDSQ